ncbi:undecaprenyl-phosphate glucose phosphotransferase [Burkholderia sp. Ac-20365]|uniref:undecaprenyl-phosphate glucose phosphotransferase n=1 Tax=Burkholderia sp. Ac-20365 TaxID=2703897 RepID=UPI00197BCB56|nr:undecaprenyl-phosphate glucose phosphotransferase [Burkholderia sp. Ac-20365]MBN3765031.1 undecaprenyl-phosphate glucose phosphotransferase [Burkholderia sp. Ac-20365]
MLTPFAKAADLICITGAAILSQSVIFSDRSSFSHIDGLLGLLGFVLPFMTFRLTRVYKPFRYDSPLSGALRAILAWLASQLILIAISHGYPDGEMRDRWFLCWTLTAACALVAARFTIHALSSLFRPRQFAPTRIAIVASKVSSDDLVAQIAAHTSMAFIPEVIFDPSLRVNTTIDRIAAVRDMNAFKQYVEAQKIREIWILNNPLRPVSVEHLLSEFRDDFINIRVLPISSVGTGSGSPIGHYRGIPVLNLLAAPERGWDIFPKEVFDRLFSFFILLAILPLLLLIAALIKLSSPGPVLFRQYRKGINGDVFSIYKFRTMFVGADKPGSVVQARRGDARITKIGGWLRRTSLDELPQFLNVLKGEMSVVGPRPHAVEHDEYYKELVQHYMFRYRIKPGITGWAQINGYRGETAEIEKMEARVKFDMFYIQNWSFWLDIKIIALTIIKGFVSKSAY